MTLIPPISASEVVGIAPFEKKREGTIAWLLLEKLRARWIEFMVGWMIVAVAFGWSDARKDL
jgi:hypothetical protein